MLEVSEISDVKLHYRAVVAKTVLVIQAQKQTFKSTE